MDARQHGYVEIDRGRNVRLVRVRALLEQWRDVSAKRPSQYGARWVLLRPESIEQSVAQLKKALAAIGRGGDAGEGSSAAPRVCLGLFAACEQLGLGFARGVMPHVYVEDARRPRGAALLERLGLRAVQEGEPADVMIRNPPWPESVFRAAVVRDGVPVADVLQ